MSSTTLTLFRPKTLAGRVVRSGTGLAVLLTAAAVLAPAPAPTSDLNTTPTPHLTDTLTPETTPETTPALTPVSTSVTLAAPRLTWPRPALSRPRVYWVSGVGPGIINAPAGQDSILRWRGATNRRVVLNGGRHWVIQGGEVNNDRIWPSNDDRAGLEFRNVTGTVYIEGLWIHGNKGIDGLRFGKGSSRTTVIVQNTRITDRYGAASPQNAHADVMQFFGGVRSLKVDRLTGTSDYQGQMWKRESGTSFGPTDFRNVNYRGLPGQEQYLVNFVMGAPVQTVTLRNVFQQPSPGFTSFCRSSVPSTGRTCGRLADGRQFQSWTGTATRIVGRITQGPPGCGDFVPAVRVGLRYRPVT